MKNLSNAEFACLSKQFFGDESQCKNSTMNIHTRIDLLRALQATGLVPLLIKNGMMFTPYDHWLYWYDMYQYLAEGQSRKNGAKDKVFLFFDRYYTNHPELNTDITLEKFERMQRFVKRPLVK